MQIILRWLDFIASHDAVVTDRFHGLIFSTIARRPCVLLPTGNHKITAALEWFRDVRFVRLAARPDEVAPLLADVLSVRERSVPDWEACFFTPLAQRIGLGSAQAQP